MEEAIILIFRDEELKITKAEEAIQCHKVIIPKKGRARILHLPSVQVQTLSAVSACFSPRRGADTLLVSFAS